MCDNLRNIRSFSIKTNSLEIKVLLETWTVGGILILVLGITVQK